MTLLPAWDGTRVTDVDGTPVGRIADVLFNARSHWPEWLVLHTRDGIAHVPHRGIRQEAGGIRLAVSAALVHSAPASAGPPSELSSAHAATLARHYGVRCGPGPWEGVAEPAIRPIAASLPPEVRIGG